MKLIDDYIAKIVDERIGVIIDTEIDKRVNAKLNEMQALLRRQTISVEGVTSTLEALIGSIQAHTESVGNLANNLSALAKRVRAIETMEGVRLDGKPPSTVSAEGGGTFNPPILSAVR